MKNYSIKYEHNGVIKETVVTSIDVSHARSKLEKLIPGIKFLSKKKKS